MQMVMQGLAEVDGVGVGVGWPFRLNGSLNGLGELEVIMKSGHLPLADDLKRLSQLTLNKVEMDKMQDINF